MNLDGKGSQAWAIRPVRSSDARAMLDLLLQLDEETTFMLLEPGERTTTLEEQERQIEAFTSGEAGYLLVCDIGDRLAGFLYARRGQARRIGHSVYIVIGVLQAYTRQGIGRRFFEELHSWALKNDLHRLELTVMTHNSGAVALYKKMGFEIEGVKRHSLKVNDQWVDEFYMAKLMPENA